MSRRIFWRSSSGREREVVGLSVDVFGSAMVVTMEEWVVGGLEEGEKRRLVDCCAMMLVKWMEWERDRRRNSKDNCVVENV